MKRVHFYWGLTEMWLCECSANVPQRQSLTLFRLFTCLSDLLL